MLRVLKDLFDTVAAPAQPAGHTPHDLHLATAVLLVEVMRADPQLGASERVAVASALRLKFPLTEDELARIVELAEERARTSNDFFQFTDVINRAFTHPEKVRMVEHMWEVAYADGHLDAHENHLISKVSGLLHVTHGEYIAAKLHAKQSSGQGG